MVEADSRTDAPGEKPELPPPWLEEERAWFGPLDWFVPATVHQQGADALRHARSVLGGTAITTVALLCIAAAESIFGAPLVALAYATAAALVLLVPPLLKASGSTSLASNAFLAVLFSLVASLTIASGGANLGVLYGACVIPLAAGLLGGWRCGVEWTFLVIALVASVAIAVQRGANFPLHIDPAAVSSAKFRGAIVLNLAVLAATLTYESIKNRAVRDFARAFERVQTEQRGRAESEHALQESEARFRSLFSNAPVCIHEVDVDGRVLSMNPAGLRILGADCEADVIGTRYLDFVAPSDRARIATVLEQACAGQVCEFDFMAIIDDERRYFESSFIPLYEPDGTVAKLIGHTHDNTERRRAAEELLASERRYQDHYENAPDMFVSVHTATAKILTCNQTVADELGYTKEQILGKRVFDFYDPDSRAAVDASFEAFLETGEATGEGLRLRRRDGTTIDVSLKISAVRDDAGQLLWTRLAWRDISDRTRVENALRQASKLESLGVLTGGIAHDFNNLLVGILGNAELAEQELAPDSPARERVAGIVEASTAAADLTNQLLAYAGERELKVEPLDLATLVGETIQLVRGSLPRGPEIEYEAVPHPAGVNADATQIRQVLLNLLINAAEAMGNETGTVRVRAGVVQADAEYLAGCHLGDRLSEGEYSFAEVTDDGDGMDRDTLARIFDPFFSTKAVGRGLGLASALGTVKGHGGAVRVDSRPGRGTTIRLLFPRTPIEERPIEKEKLVRVAGGATILLVDDDKSVRSVTERLLRRIGFEVVPAAGGQEALDIASEPTQPIAAVMLDFTMPGLSGDATFRELRRIRPELPVLFFSGHSEAGATSTVESLRTAFLAKPFRQAELSGKLAELLGG